jgi:hypothetical protein
MGRTCWKAGTGTGPRTVGSRGQTPLTMFFTCQGCWEQGLEEWGGEREGASRPNGEPLGTGGFLTTCLNHASLMEPPGP